MLARDAVQELLAPFGVVPSDVAIDSLLVYLELLLRWNRKINLTSISTAEECVTRHFGESFLASKSVQLQGTLLDVGSGAGFPGLALKLIAPDLDVTLLEPVAKKRAFLKEVARACNMSHVNISGSRLEEFSTRQQASSFDIITVRAVGHLESLVQVASGLLKREGHLCLWVGRQQVPEIRQSNPGLAWMAPVAIPASMERQILVGARCDEED